MSDKPQFPRQKVFRAWIEQRKNAQIGKPWDTVDCPMARFLRWYFDASCVIVTRGYTQVRWSSSETKNFRLPKWAREFVLMVDHFEHFRTDAGNVTGTRALWVLDSIQ